VSTTIACDLCERPISNAPADAGPVLCPLCAANAGLVRAWREGLARKSDAERPA
jgi:hypothetical protein